MDSKLRDGPTHLISKPSTAFSTASAASATSAGTSRSGGSRLLFGEIDTSSERSTDSYASVCSFVLCDSSTFLKFWLEDKCRDTFLRHLPKSDLASLRLACHDFSVRAAPALFEDLTITFKTKTFTKPSKLAELDRLGFYVKTLHFNLPHSAAMFLPPLIEPETGAELSFTYTPQIQDPGSSRRPRYGDVGTTEILSRQYPALFHAATNVSAFVRAFSAFVNLQHLEISCPGYDKTQRYRRSIVDFALISLRIAVERNSLNALDRLTISPIHPAGIMYLSPLLGFGSSPRSAARWSRIKHLNIKAFVAPAMSDSDGGERKEPDGFKLLQTYLRNFQRNLESFRFSWIGGKGPLPVMRPSISSSTTKLSPSSAPQHPAFKTTSSTKPLHFPHLALFSFTNVTARASDLCSFISLHKPTIEELNLEDMFLSEGTWDDALAPIQPPSSTRKTTRRREIEEEVPIMLSPTFMNMNVGKEEVLLPRRMEKVEVVGDARGAAAGRKSVRVSRWLGNAGSRGKSTKLRDGVRGCEEQLRKVFRGSALPWV